jgi:hypothetical protein
VVLHPALRLMDLGEAVAAVRAQIRGEPDLEAMFEDAINLGQGGDRRSADFKVYNVHSETPDAPAPAPPAPKGNARARAVLKLRTEAERPNAYQAGAKVGTIAPPRARFHNRGDSTDITWIGSPRRLSRAHGAQ